MVRIILSRPRRLWGHITPIPRCGRCIPSKLSGSLVSWIFTISLHMGGSWNGGTPQWMVWNGKTQPKMVDDWGYPYDWGTPHILMISWWYPYLIPTFFVSQLRSIHCPVVQGPEASVPWHEKVRIVRIFSSTGTRYIQIHSLWGIVLSCNKQSQ